MKEIVLRLSVVMLISLCAFGVVCAVYLLLQRRQQAARTQKSLLEHELQYDPSARVRILAFLNEDCRQCRTLQAPVLRRVQEVYGDIVTVVNIDMASSPALAQRYHVMTVPTTILLDTHGKTHTINYGFTNAQSLLRQIDEVLTMDISREEALL